MKNTMNQKTKCNKLELVYKILIIILMGLVDAGVVIFGRTSGLGFMETIGKKKLLLLLLLNAAVVFLLFFAKRIKEKTGDKLFIKIINIATLIVTPVLVFGVVQVVVSQGYFEMLKEYILPNMIVCYVLYLLFLLVFGKVSTAISAYTIILLVLAMVDYFVTMFRGNAFVLMDVLSVGTAMEVAGTYVFKIPVKTGICIVLMLAFIVYQHFFQTLRIGKKDKKWYLARVGIFALIFVGIYGNRSWLKKEAVRMWDIDNDYRTKGYIYKLACETQYLSSEKPEDYSVEKVKEIAAQTEEKAEKTETTKIVPKKLIVIMNESLSDFEEFDNFKSSEEILPTIHSLKENTKKGHLYVPVFGGGTANTEYELLTGNSVQFLPSGGMAYLLYCRDPEYGMAHTLDQLGFSTTALHPYKAKNWNRPSVYEDMKFGEFISLENWDNPIEKYRRYATDASTFDKLEKLTDQGGDANQFLFCVTMQNHGSYGSAKNFKPYVTLDYGQKYPRAELYLSLEKESDKAFADLIQHYQNEEEPTMIVMFGDHWPEIEHSFFSELFGKDFDNLGVIDVQKSHRTPYVIWTNYPSESGEEDMSSNYFGSYIMEQAGLPLTTYNQFLLQLKETLPVIGTDAVCDADGNWYEMNDLPEEYAKLINEYKILQYNNVFDRRHRVDEVFQYDRQ